MATKKKLSYEDKRTKLLELFYETEEFYNLKELERLGQKLKGIVSQTVKEILQSLVDDNLVETEKIGISNYFWAYPSKGFHVRKQTIEKLTEELKCVQDKIQQQQNVLAESKIGREEHSEREAKLKLLEEKRREKQHLDEEYLRYRDSDPEVIGEIRKKIKTARQAANRWTDNIFSVKSWCRDNFQISNDDMDQQFEIPPDIDYIEE